MRIYHVGNMYMSSIQQGIQAAHAQMEMFVKYIPRDFKAEVEYKKISQLVDWSNNHKTMICLNGGYDSELRKFKDILDVEHNPFPWSCFYESKEAMNGMLTNVAIVIPERIYGRNNRVRLGETILVNGVEYLPTQMFFANGVPTSEIVFEFTEYESVVWDFLSNCGLAR
jgi:hypothetical protein